MANKLTHAERIIRLEYRIFRQSVKRELAKYDMLAKPHSAPSPEQQRGGFTASEVGQQLHDIRMARKLMGISE